MCHPVLCIVEQVGAELFVLVTHLKRRWKIKDSASASQQRYKMSVSSRIYLAEGNWK